jgi:hypothetical protein
VQRSIPGFLETLKVLTRRRVDFIIVGGVSAVLHGAPVTKFDLDVVHARDRENVIRLLSALEEFDAVYRVQPERQLRPNGPLGMIGKSRTWKELLTISPFYRSCGKRSKRGPNGRVERLNTPGVSQVNAPGGTARPVSSFSSIVTAC